MYLASLMIFWLKAMTEMVMFMMAHYKEFYNDPDK